MPVLKVKKNGVWEELGGTSPMDGGNADTLDGKHASEFALSSDVEDLQTKVGDTSVSAQIESATQGYATETYVNEKVADLVNSAPETLNTLNELAKALGDDPSFATTISTQIGDLKTKVGDTSVSDQIDNALANFSSGKTLSEHLVEEDMILSSRQYGDELPGENGEPYTHVPGRIFFLKVSD